MWSRGIIFLGLFALFFALSSAVPVQEFYGFDEPEQVVMEQFNEYEEFVAGKDYEFKEHSYDGQSGIYRFRHSKAIAKRTIVNLNKLNVKRLRCNSKRNQISFAAPAGFEGDNLDGKVVFFQPTFSSGCGTSRGYYFVESVETDSSDEDQVLVKAHISEQNPKELLESVEAAFYQEDIRDEVARVISYEEDDAELSSSDLQEGAPEEVRQKIREIQQSELHSAKRFKKRFFGRLWKAIESVGSKVMDVQQKLAKKFTAVKDFLVREHVKTFPSDKDSKQRVYENTFPITWTRKWTLDSVEVTARAEAAFTVDFRFSFTIQSLVLKRLEFSIGCRAEFTGGLTIAATLNKVKNFKSLTAGATFRIPTVVAPGLTILLNPYVRLEGQAKFNVNAKVDFTKMFVMPRWTRTWTYNGDASPATTKINGASPAENAFMIKPLKEDAPYTAAGTANADLFITPILGLQLGVSALDLFDLMGGPIVKVPLQFSAMATLKSAYTKDEVQSCVVALHFSLQVQAGVTIEFKVLGISAIQKEWVYTFRRSDEKKTDGNAAPAMTEIHKKQEPVSGSGLKTLLTELRTQKLTKESQLATKRAARALCDSSASEIPLTLSDPQKELYRAAFGRAPPTKVISIKWEALGEVAEREATKLENEIFALQTQIDEITTSNLIRLRDDFVRQAVGKADSAIPDKLKTDFTTLTGTAWSSAGSEGNKYRLITQKLKLLQVEQKDNEAKTAEGLQRKLVFFSFCLFEAIADGAAAPDGKQKVKFQIPTWMASAAEGKLINSEFPKLVGGEDKSKWRYKNDKAFIDAFLLAESRGQTDPGSEENSEEEKAEKHGWVIKERPAY